MNKAMCVWLVAVGIGGCAGDDANGLRGPGADSPGVLTRVEAAGGAECAGGGSIVLAGNDHNGNGALDAEEIVTRTVVCNPAVDVPPTVVVRLVAEPDGANCAHGGTAVQSGPDRNGSGTLDPDEIDHTDYVCGDHLVTRIVAEPEGAHCGAGGAAFQVGIDRDGDGVLDDDEVAQTEYECGDVLARDVSIHTQAELAALAQVKIIQGTLALVGADPSLQDVTLPALQAITRSLQITNVKLLERIALPQLQVVGASFVVSDDAALTTLSAPLLANVGGTFDVSRNPALVTMSNPVVVHDDVRVRDNASLPTLSVPVTLSGEIEISGNGALGELSAAISSTTRHVQITGNHVTTLSLTGRTADPVAALPAIEVRDNVGLTNATVSATTIAALQIAGNAELTTVSVTGDVAGDLVLEGARLDAVTLGAGSFRGPKLGGALSLTGPISSLQAAGDFQVAGDFALEGTLVGELPGLTRVGGTFRLRNNQRLNRTQRLIALHGGVELVGNLALQSLLFSALGNIDGDIVVTDNPRLDSVGQLLNGTVIHGNVTIRNNAVISLVGGLTKQIDGALEITGNPALADVSFDVTQVGGAITISNNAALDVIVLDDLAAAGAIHVEDNATLLDLFMSNLASTSSITVRRNPHLPTCEVTAIFAHVRGGSRTQSGNDDAGTCD